jgi:hypothetical protein
MFLFVREHPESGIPYYQYIIDNPRDGLYLVMSLDKVIPIIRYFTTLQKAKDFIRNTEGIRRLDVPTVNPVVRHSPFDNDGEDDNEDDDESFSSSSSFSSCSILSGLESRIKPLSEEGEVKEDDSIPVSLPEMIAKEKKQRRIPTPSKLQQEFRDHVRTQLTGKKFKDRHECNAFFKALAHEYKQNRNKIPDIPSS